MFHYGKTSKERLSTVDPRLQAVFDWALRLGLVDISIIEGYRGKERQNSFFPKKSRVRYPNSKHNSIPSQAIDAAPFVNGEISWKRVHCIYLAGIIVCLGAVMGVRIRWGGNWDMDGEPITDQDFQDLVHYEVID